MKHTNTLCEQNAEFWYVKSYRTYALDSEGLMLDFSDSVPELKDTLDEGRKYRQTSWLSIFTDHNEWLKIYCMRLVTKYK
jgi:hypothetical protein